MDFPKVDEVYKLLSSKLESWIEGAITLLPNLVVAFLIAILFGVIAKMVLIGTAMDPFHWRRNGPTPFVP